MVGRESADILLPDKTVSRQHARVEFGESGLVSVEDLSSTNGTHLNNELLVPHISRHLTDGDLLRFGSIQTVFRLPQHEPTRSDDIPFHQESEEAEVEQPDGPPPVALAYLVDMRDGDARRFPLVPGVTTFGRRAENSVVLQGDPYVSGSHAQIIADEDVFRLTDVGSTNGTLLNGERLGANEPVTLSPGDVILIGGTALRFEPVTSNGELTPETATEEPPAEPRERNAQEYDAPNPERTILDTEPQDTPTSGVTREDAPTSAEG